MDAYDLSLLVAVELLRDCESVLRDTSSLLLTVKPYLEEPYTDAPETTPWESFAEPVARRAMDLKIKVRNALKDLPEPPEEPFICPDCHKGRDDHTFAEIVGHLYGLPDEEARAIVRRVMDRLRS